VKAFLLGKLLGIVQAWQIKHLRQDDCCSHNRTRQRTSASFIDTGNRSIALTARHGFKKKGGLLHFGK
jgi:hypothetical protein